MAETKPFTISKQLIWDSYLQVKRNAGSAGIDNESIEDFEKKLKSNLYQLWNRMASGTYFPPPVKGVPIPKKSGGTRMLGIPTVSDRIAQTAAKIVLEKILEPIFHADSYGYRAGKSAHEAVETTRQRCWRFDWVVEFDIKGFFDNMDHDLLLKAVRHHCKVPWVLLYVKRWLETKMHIEGHGFAERLSGTPQGGVISPILANLFMHYAFDCWVERELPGVKFCRYADDGILHCKTLKQAELVFAKIEKRFSDCGLQMHTDKSKIVYCKDSNRQKEYHNISFDFLGFTFQPRKSQDKYGRRFVNFTPAISGNAQKTISQAVRGWHLQIKSDKSLHELSRLFNPKIKGWWNYYGRFYRSKLVSIANRIDLYLARWARRKYKSLATHNRRSSDYIRQMAKEQPHLFAHWNGMKGLIVGAG
jgi:RNA-directed DNA polymerase